MHGDDKSIKIVYCLVRLENLTLSYMNVNQLLSNKEKRFSAHVIKQDNVFPKTFH